MLAVVFLPRFVTGTTDVRSLISHGENSIVSVSVSLHTHVSYRLDRKSASSGRKQDSNTYVRRSQAVSGTVREMLVPISAGTQIILTLVDLQLDAQNSYLFTYSKFIKVLYMFRALPCSSSGGLRSNCIYLCSLWYRHSLQVTVLCTS